MMGIAFLQCAFVLIFASLSLARDGMAQKVLDQKITVQIQNQKLPAVLRSLEKAANVRFAYIPQLVSTNKRVSVNAKDEALGSVLNGLLLPNGLAYEVSGDFIVLKKYEGAEKGSMSKNSSTKNVDITVNGKVTDENGGPLPGVSVVLRGTQRGTTTDTQGDFSLNVPDQTAVLVFSFVGYKSQEVTVGSQSTINLSLLPDESALDEVVVVGYGTQKKVNVIGSVSQIGEKQLENRPVTQVSQAITGQMPGVTVTQNTGRPGVNGGTIRVRGVGSFGATPNALVLIDGIPGDMNDVNPNDIKTISVLKDASSAAIYGARSANGVVLITTKMGVSDKLSVSYDGYTGFNTATKLPDFVNSWEYAEMFNIASGSNSFPAEEIAKYRAQNDPDNYPNTRFLEDLFSSSGQQTQHTITLNGGNENNKFFLSGGILQQQGIVPKNKYQRFNQRLNLQNKIGNHFEITTRLSGSIDKRDEPQATGNKGGDITNQLIQNAVRYPAIFLGQASNGDFGLGPESGGTPAAWLASDSYRRAPTSRFGINTKLDWKPLPGLIFSAIGGYNFSLLEERSYYASQRLTDQITLNQSSLNQESNKQIYKTMQFTGEYNRELKNHFFSALLGYSFEQQDFSYFNSYRQDFPSNQYTVLDLGGLENQQNGGFDAAWAIQSVFSRLKYSFMEKYLVEVTVRNDGSSRFPDGQKYALFPSAAVGWRLGQEDFMKSIPWLSNLKLKASYGVLGNQNIGNYPYQQVLAAGRNYPFGNTLNIGAAYANYTDPNIKWESTTTFDLGVESGFFNNKLLFNVTYFDRQTDDILFRPSSSVSSVLGVNIGETNTGAMSNKGWEFDLSHRNRIKDFGYSFNANFSIINNEVVTLGLGNVTQPNGLVGNGSNLFIGYPMQMFYGYLSDGVFLNQDDITQWPDQTKVTPKAEPGDIRYKDISGPEGVPDGKVDPTYDRTYLGSQIPKYTFGANLGFTYKSFDFSTFLQGVAGVSGQLGGYAGYAFNNLGNIQRWQMDGRFNPDNPTRYPDYPRLEVITNSGTPNTVDSDFWVLNSSYLRIKNLQLGYSLPENWLKPLHISRTRIYVSAENLLTFSKYRQGWDPEINGVDIPGSGNNGNGAYYPILRTVTFGINLKL
ncbi:SusC/RagA family TonB-linked outer membrane protein [Persicitalea jodogahamensis]|uniref:SusC/RagA family TonB-linked outer membrane protein n=2 Tax=Persicitalea jodogahamensis TaxID=402147 RepID=A0A8J3D9P1_9BACT|nr:SusC/RagA family TonB-linked outer membrane protein [Persicitalea jodogahamensis]